MCTLLELEETRLWGQAEIEALQKVLERVQGTLEAVEVRERSLRARASSLDESLQKANYTKREEIKRLEKALTKAKEALVNGEASYQAKTDALETTLLDFDQIEEAWTLKYNALAEEKDKVERDLLACILFVMEQGWQGLLLGHA
jgi:chromosome segregation ATPase